MPERTKATRDGRNLLRRLVIRFAVAVPNGMNRYPGW